MSTYYNAQKANGFNLNRIAAPKYLKDFLNYELVIKNLAPRTVHNYYISLRLFLLWLGRNSIDVNQEEIPLDIKSVSFEAVAAVTTMDIFDFLAYCSSQRQCGSSSRASKLSAIKAFYHYQCQIAKNMENDPAADVTPPKMESHQPKYLSRREAMKLLSVQAMSNSETPRRNYCILTLFINCGMRLSELTGMNVSDIHSDRVVIRGKGRKERTVFLNDACLTSLESYIEERETYPKIVDEDALFISRRKGQRLTGRAVEKMVDKALLNAGLKRQGYSPHKLRHTAATLMYQSGAAGILEIKEILGHQNTSTTEIYTHLEPENLRQVANNFPELREGRRTK